MVENLINDLMDLAKMENNKFKMEIDNFNLIETVNETLEIMLHTACSKKIEFNVQIDKESNLQLISNLQGDSRRIKQILLNFVSNSLKFTPAKGKITIKIRVKSERTQTN